MAGRINKVSLTIILSLGFIVLSLGLLLVQYPLFGKKPDLSQFHGTYLEHPRTISAFSLDGMDKKAFNERSLQGHWTLLFFGFTSCAYLCPTTMAELAKMYRILEQQGIKELPQIVMVSVDPERDSLERLAVYAQTFHPKFYAARGTEAVIQNLTRELGISFTKVYNKKTDSKKIYDVEHSGALILFDPHGALTAFFTTPHQAEVLARDYVLLAS